MSSVLIAGRLRSSILRRVDRGAVVGEVDRGIRLGEGDGKLIGIRRKGVVARQTKGEKRVGEGIGRKEELVK